MRQQFFDLAVLVRRQTASQHIFQVDIRIMPVELGALEQLQAHKAAPTFMTLETVAAHLVNIDPASGTQSQELTYRYADQQLGEFVRQLKATGFSEHGTLIITADHRAMVPMGQQEHVLYGDCGYVRVPLAVVGTGLVEREESAGFSQTDLPPSPRNAMASGVQCTGTNQGVFLPTVVRAPKCIYTNRSYNTNNVFVHCGADEISIELNGDQTKFTQAQGQPVELLQELHRLRLGKGFSAMPDPPLSTDNQVIEHAMLIHRHEEKKHCRRQLVRFCRQRKPLICMSSCLLLIRLSVNSDTWALQSATELLILLNIFSGTYLG